MVLQHLTMRTAAPVWKIIFLECDSFPQIFKNLNDISESVSVFLENIV